MGKMESKVLKFWGNLNISLLIGAFVFISGVSSIILSGLPIIEHLILLKELMLLGSILYLRKSYLRRALFGGFTGLALHSVFIAFNYQFFTVYNVRYNLAFSEDSIFIYIPIIDRILFVYFLSFYLILLNRKSQNNTKEQSIIRRALLDLSTQHTRLELKELSERTNLDRDTIKNTAVEMIQNYEIYAEYFSSSKSIVFNQEANTEEIDRLMKMYDQWEKKQYGKI